jgi:hypothetical protein
VLPTCASLETSSARTSHFSNPVEMVHAHLWNRQVKDFFPLKVVRATLEHVRA